jgi:hypothetical protein
VNTAGPPGAPAAPPCGRWWRWLAVGLALTILLYGFGYLVWYLATPLGQAPQLDGKENLALAGQIAAGTLPHEPFYRAMLYPLALAVLRWIGLSDTQIPQAAALAGLLCHFAATLGVARLASRLWAGPGARTAALLAAGLWGLYPVALFYAVDVLDTMPSLALFIWGLVWWTRPEGRARDAMIGGIFLGLAVAARPHFLPVALVAPLACAWLGGRWRVRRSDAAAWAGAAIPLILAGCAQWFWCGEFRILPWQGAYNFYSANRPGANGRYFAQQIFFTQLAPGENPARRESEILYARATGRMPPFTAGEMESYWDGQAWSAIGAHPGAWLKLMTRKTYYLLNDFEQYNNKTFLWHARQSPWLRPGIIFGWGMLFTLAAMGATAAWARAGTPGDSSRHAKLAGYLLVFAVYAAGVLVYYASGRFRLPLAPLLCVLAGGLGGGWGTMRRNGARVIVPMIAAGVLAGGITFSNHFNARDESTFIQDEMLQANAATEIGDDQQAYDLARQVAENNPERIDARRIAAVSYFDLSLTGNADDDTVAGWKEVLPDVQGLETEDAALALVAGVAHWKTGDPAGAEQIWAEGTARFGADSAPAKALAAARAERGEATAGSPPPDPDMAKYLAKAAAAGK